MTNVLVPHEGHDNFTIVEGYPNHLVDGIPVAFEGCHTDCNAVLISSLKNYGTGLASSPNLRYRNGRNALHFPRPTLHDGRESIILRSGGAFIEIKGGKITAGGTAGWLGQFASVSWVGPSSQDAKTRWFGKSNVKTNEFFRIMQGGDPLAGIRYEITLESGQVIGGRTDRDGRTQVAMNQLTQRAKLKLFPDDVAGA